MIERMTTPYGVSVNCPRCGGLYMNHGKVEIFNRIHEDAPVGHHVTVIDQHTDVDVDMSDNPSSRRQGIVVHMACEECGGGSIMTIVQHKGITFIDVIDE